MKRPIPFGKYYLLERVNVGGMAEVFKAKTYGVEGFERLLAVKRILPNIAEDEEFITMFIDEAKIAVQLNHANIAQIFDLGKVEESFFIALEYIHGKDVRAIFDRCRALTETMPIPQACFIIMKVCEGLDYAHNKRDSIGREMNLVHRDVSPQNVLISYEGEVKLVDFGIAKAAGKASKTQAGILKGKFGYMSPEQVRGLPLDRRSDIFSVGIVLYELLTGERLFTGESDFSTLEKVRNVEILPPSTYNRKIAEELEQIVLKSLAKDVEDRYQNAIDLHDDLQAYMYTSGEFYSRKDLAGWMKRTFTREIEEEGRKLEEYRQLPPPPSGPPPVPGVRLKPPVPPPPPGGNGKRASPPPLRGATPTPDAMPPPLSALESDPGVAAEASQPEAVPSLSWEDDEVETQIYDKPAGQEPDPPSAKAQSVPAAAPVKPSPPALPKTPPAPPDKIALDQTASPVLTKKQTAKVPALPPPVAFTKTRPVVVDQRRNRLALWLTVAFLAAALCGGSLYYFYFLGKKPGHIIVAAAPSDVEVYLDGRRQPGSGTPLTIRSLKPGFYILALVKTGYERWTRTVEVKPGETVQLSPQLDAVSMASIELITEPRGGEAFLDGDKLSGRTPMRISRVPPGKHRLEVRKPPYQAWNHEFEARPDQVLRLHARLLPVEVAVQITSQPAAEAFLVRDGQSESVGQTPVQLKLNPRFPYSVSVKKDGYRTWTRAIQFDGDAPLRLAATLEREGAEPKVVTRPEPKKAEPKVVTRPEPKKAEPKVVTRPEPKKAEPKVVTRPEPKKAEPKVHPRPKLVVPTPKPKTKQTPKIAIKPEPTPPEVDPQPSGNGTLLVNSNPWTKIIIDGADTGLTTPQKKIPLSAGKHTIVLRNPKFNIDESITITIKPGQPTKLIKNFPVSESK